MTHQTLRSLAVILISTSAAVLGLNAARTGNRGWTPFWRAGFTRGQLATHIVGAALLLAGAVVLLISATQ